MPDSRAPQDTAIASTLVLVPISIVASALLWRFIAPPWAFAAPAIMLLVAPVQAIALEPDDAGRLLAVKIPRVRNAVWLALALQAAVMAAVIWG